MRNRHVEVKKCDITFKFVGKSGKEHNISLTDCALADIVKHCRACSGDLLFQYTDDGNTQRRVTSTDVNRYLRTISGQCITAKDFRTWWGTVLATLALAQLPPPDSVTASKRQISAVIKEVAAHLGNTPTVCRKSYIHPAVLTAFAEGRPIGRIMKKNKPVSPAGVLLPEEQAVVRFLKSEWAQESKT
jgi:DNA topoisomerase-1